MQRPHLEVADILVRHAPAYPYSLSGEQARVLRALQVCRTAHLGGHLERCSGCGHESPAYNSCRDRHCPKCQSLAKARWVARQTADLLPVPYFHLVFTMPSQLVGLSQQNQRVLYDILFGAAAEALTTIAADPKHLGAEIGFLAVLHTWGQSLQAHPHIHCVVPGGGLSLDGQRWVGASEKFFLPVRVLSRLYRGLFVSRLRAAYSEGTLEFHGQLAELGKPKMFDRLLRKMSDIEWVVYAKRPFGGPEQVVNYLGRYTHRVAISNRRLLKLEDGNVSFLWKDYRRSKDGSGTNTSIMTLEANEFIRRFLLFIPTKDSRAISRSMSTGRNRTYLYAQSLGTATSPQTTIYFVFSRSLSGGYQKAWTQSTIGETPLVSFKSCFDIVLREKMKDLGPYISPFLPVHQQLSEIRSTGQR